MTRLLHIDSSARSGGSDTQAYGSHSRRLSGRFVRRWRELRPDDETTVRDVGLHPPAPVTGGWIHAAFTPPERREAWMRDALAESDALVDELLAADVIVVGVPMYNFGMPAQLKAWIDNVVRVGRTFGFDRSREGEPYWPMLADHGKQLILLSSRGDYGYGKGERLEAINHVEPGVLTPMRYIGIVESHGVAAEYDEFGGERLRASLERAEREVDALVDRLVAERSLRAVA
ncbi:NAD(P)H-dependent oxidoreductase [Lysobacter sp. K5869]|uniref:FMN-dependent NADH-azoreductase n=1 Tax=Lysobacter sp. K5869 TaxID=2820808 RepID=UPI001C0608B2|nr:NAD(P)H-dependent oxidoreductase [Lysobacter sp. K5869]QWP77247.1 NAD(P)H-dependent oxidoreductase [Lysobacter sp. K5869]